MASHRIQRIKAHVFPFSFIVAAFLCSVILTGCFTVSHAEYPEEWPGLEGNMDSVFFTAAVYCDLSVEPDSSVKRNYKVNLSGLLEMEAIPGFSFVKLSRVSENLFEIQSLNETDSVVSLKQMTFKPMTSLNDRRWLGRTRYVFAGFKTGEPILGFYSERIFFNLASDRSLIVLRKDRGFGLVYLILPVYFDIEEIHRFMPSDSNPK